MVYVGIIRAVFLRANSEVGIIGESIQFRFKSSLLKKSEIQQMQGDKELAIIPINILTKPTR
jgi:hypothetical protein